MQPGNPCILQKHCGEHSKLIKAPKGSTIFMPYQRVSHIYHLHEGIVALFVTTPEGHEVNTTLCVPPNFIGLIGFTGMYTDGKTYYHSVARALTPVVYCKTKREAVWDLLDDRQVRAQVFDEAYNLLFLTSRLSAIPVKKDVEERIIVVLYALAESMGKQGSDGSIVISQISHEVLASIANTTRATVSRLLQQLEREGLIIHGHRREIVIPNYLALLAKSTLLADPLHFND